MKFTLNGREFKKSTFSGSEHCCVGVSIGENEVHVTNSKTRDAVVKFTKQEWNAFLKGVKNKEFEL